MKINKGGAVRVAKLDDPALNKTFGTLYGRTSDDDATAVRICHTQLQAARHVRHRWTSRQHDLSESLDTNQSNIEVLAGHEPRWTSIAAEALEYILSDRRQLVRELLLVHAQVALCDRVIAALTATLAARTPAVTYRAAVATGGGPLNLLSGTLAAADRATTRFVHADSLWDTAFHRFIDLADQRNAFAKTDAALTLDRLDATTADAFERSTAWLLQRDGCTVLRAHGGAHDQGADVIAITPCGRRIVLRCKHSTKLRNRVDPRYLYELHGTAGPIHHAQIVGIVTNRTLSGTARQFADTFGIHVIDRDTLRQWATFGVTWWPAAEPATR